MAGPEPSRQRNDCDARPPASFSAKSRPWPRRTREVAAAGPPRTPLPSPGYRACFDGATPRVCAPAGETSTITTEAKANACRGRGKSSI